VPSAQDMFNSVAAAPVPFIGALILTVTVIWGLMEWAHRAVINKQRATLESARPAAQGKEAKLELTIIHCATSSRSWPKPPSKTDPAARSDRSGKANGEGRDRG
jgi:hypothetical protein